MCVGNLIPYNCEEGAAGGVAAPSRFRDDEDASSLAYRRESAQRFGDLFASGDCASMPFARDAGLVKGGGLGRADLKAVAACPQVAGLASS